MGNSQSGTTTTPSAARPSVSNLPFNYHQQGKDWIVDNVCDEQSPIDIIPNQAVFSNMNMKMEFMLSDETLTGLEVKDIGTSLVVNGGFSKLRATDLNGNTYEFEAVQFHFHAPAEHTISGGRYPLELHIVHQMTEESHKISQTHRDLAVVGIFFELDKSPSATSNNFIQALQLHNVGASIDLNMHELLAGELKRLTTYYAYKGSLTTPPCSERANWYLFETPLKITEAQLDYFNQRWQNNDNFAGGRGNFREIQPLCGRTIMKSSNCCVFKRSAEPKTPVIETPKPLAKKDIIFPEVVDNGRFARSSTEGFVDFPILRRSKSKELKRPETEVAKIKNDSGNKLAQGIVPNQGQDFYSV